MMLELPKKNVTEIQKALEICSGDRDDMICNGTGCPYEGTGSGCMTQMMKDAAFMLLLQRMQMQADDEDTKQALKRAREAETMVKTLTERVEALDAKESQRKRGQWKRDDSGWYQCSTCRWGTNIKWFKYCPCCGTEMEVEP